MTDAEWKAWYKRWLAGKEIEEYPCGCTGQMEEGVEGRERLLILVSDNCPKDLLLVGRVSRYVRHAKAL